MSIIDDLPKLAAAGISERLAKLNEGMAGLLVLPTAWDAPYRAALDWQVREESYLNQACAIGAPEEAARDMLKAVVAERAKVREMLEHGLGGADRIFDHDLNADVFTVGRRRLTEMTFAPEPEPGLVRTICNDAFPASMEHRVTAPPAPPEPDRTLGTAYARWKARSG